LFSISCKPKTAKLQKEAAKTVARKTLIQGPRSGCSHILQLSGKNKFLRALKQKSCRLKMKITLVGSKGKKKKLVLPSGATIRNLAAKQGLPGQSFLFSKNGELCHESDPLKDGDTVELVRVFSGG